MRKIIIAILLLWSINTHAQSAAEKYVTKYDSLAVEVLNKYGIPASVVLGIAMQETGAGTSKLCRVNHNHFGVKGRVKSSKTKSGYSSQYRSFDSDEAAYLHFGEMISKKKYYSALKGNMDYLKWLKAMKAANYATSSTWVSAVNSLIKKHNLTRFDLQTSYPIVSSPTESDSLNPQSK